MLQQKKKIKIEQIASFHILSSKLQTLDGAGRNDEEKIAKSHEHSFTTLTASLYL